jgi:DNA-binding helix-hairpin-helix protein with protein kinase domain
MKDLASGTSIKLTDGSSIKVKKELGRGGQGVVFLVDYNGKDMALKWYHNPPPMAFYQNLQRNVDEGAPSSAFIWPKYLTARGQYDSYGYVMDLRSNDYKEFGQYLMARTKFKSLDAMLAAALRICEGFQMLHLKGYSYQDLNDGNFFINPNDGDVLICDNDNVMPQGDKSGILGKARYMAPEIVTGKDSPDKYSDRFSLSVLLFLLVYASHPFEGAKVLACPCLTEKFEKEFYGSKALFIYDEKDSSNRPVMGVHTNVIRRWPVFPKELRDMFTKEFSQDRLANKTLRCIEGDWRRVFTRVRDQLVICPHCKEETFTETGKCACCGKPIKITQVIKIDGRVLDLTPGTLLYLDNDNKPDGEVVVNKDALWVKNLSPYKWHVETPSGQVKVVDPNGLLPAKPGLKVSFGPQVKGTVDVK